MNNNNLFLVDNKLSVIVWVKRRFVNKTNCTLPEVYHKKKKIA